MNLRRIFGTQAEIARAAARHAAQVAPELVERFVERERTYQLLGTASRNLGGLVGKGGPAAAESANARDRLRRSPTSTEEDAPALHELARLFTATDAGIADTIERGLEQKLYFVSIKFPRLGGQETAGGVLQPRERWIPVTSSVQTDLLPIVRDRLRPPPAPSVVPEKSVTSRQDYELLLVQQPGARAASRPGR